MQQNIKSGRMRRKSIVAIVAIILLGVITWFYFGRSHAPQANLDIPEVKVMKVIVQDTPIIYTYAGQVYARDSVDLRANVTGRIVEKLFKGGDYVEKGQPLYRIDRRIYETAVLNAEAQLAQAQVTLSNIHEDTLRNQQLGQNGAISKQTLDTQIASEGEQTAVVEAYRAKLQQAKNDLNDTVVVAPISGRVAVNEISTGNYVQAGATTLTTVSSLEPVYVQFSMSENEYLRLNKERNEGKMGNWGDHVRIKLSSGGNYPLDGKVVETDSQMAQNSGALVLKAEFANPKKMLLPGMFAKVEVTGEVRKNAMLIPQRAVQQILDKTFVMTISADNKVQSRPIILGIKIGNLWMVESGLQPTDTVIVEGLLKARPDMTVKTITMSLKELDNSLKAGN
ncbi:MAG: efflux RND transporter periplasmic adaptor subunit [Negativicutes bacterium]|jgi:membrane fusion protein (multidrug efflux system)